MEYQRRSAVRRWLSSVRPAHGAAAGLTFGDVDWRGHRLQLTRCPTGGCARHRRWQAFTTRTLRLRIHWKSIVNHFEMRGRSNTAKDKNMNRIVYLIGAIVIIVAVLSFLGLR